MNHFASELTRRIDGNVFAITATNNAGDSASDEANPPRPMTPHVPDGLLTVGASPPPVKRCKSMWPPDINPGDDVIITSEVINSPGKLISLLENYECS